jgi:hypothetical protein
MRRAKMTKQELIQAAKEISDICQSRGYTWKDCSREPKCQFFDDNPDVWQCVFCIRGQDGYPPQAWDIERLEREGNDD